MTYAKVCHFIDIEDYKETFETNLNKGEGINDIKTLIALSFSISYLSFLISTYNI